MPRSERGRAVGLLLAAAVLALAGTALLVVTAERIGALVYDDAPTSTWSLLVPLWGGLALEAAAVAAGGVAGVELSVGRRRDVMAHALAADPDRLERVGAGDALALALDAELVGSVLVTAAPGALLGAIEVAVGVALLARTADRVPRLMVAAVVAVAIVGLTRVVLRRRRAWVRARGSLAGSLAERLIGQRTVALQETTADREDAHGRALDEYAARSRALDRSVLVLRGSVHVGVAALLLVALAAGGGDAPASTLAPALAAALLTGVGAERLRHAIIELVSARVAHDGVAELAAMAASAPPAVELGDADPTLLVRATGVVTGYRAAADAPAVDLTVQRGDVLLVGGPSGAGKTTLVEVLDGRRAPQAGLVERAAGASVRRVPQAGDDHLFHASLLCNVVGGVAWPPTPEVEADAAALLDELGLGPLVERMPAGALQPIGNGGWRLSSGEAARVRLARALVARPDVVILDETFAALDAATRDLALGAARRWAGAVVVIAHP